ncbi:MAG: PIN domain-containing protein [Acidobacteria bacterium]|nr:PIN domain-containing protein [Acidobacteriota bacterium]
MRIYFDTSVLVAASVRGHPHHASAIHALEAMVTQGHHGYMSAHSLAEVYSVLTRTPFVPAVYPSEAWQILEVSILPHLEVVALSALEYKDLVRQCAADGQIGGRVYDCIHLHCAQKAECDRLYTFNVRDFQVLAPEGLRERICAP